MHARMHAHTHTLTHTLHAPLPGSRRRELGSFPGQIGTELAGWGGGTLQRTGGAALLHRHPLPGEGQELSLWLHLSAEESGIGPATSKDSVPAACAGSQSCSSTSLESYLSWGWGSLSLPWAALQRCLCLPWDSGRNSPGRSGSIHLNLAWDSWVGSAPVPGNLEFQPLPSLPCLIPALSPGPQGCLWVSRRWHGQPAALEVVGAVPIPEELLPTVQVHLQRRAHAAFLCSCACEVDGRGGGAVPPPRGGPPPVRGGAGGGARTSISGILRFWPWALRPPPRPRRLQRAPPPGQGPHTWEDRSHLTVGLRALSV